MGGGYSREDAAKVKRIHQLLDMDGNGTVEVGEVESVQKRIGIPELSRLSSKYTDPKAEIDFKTLANHFGSLHLKSKDLTEIISSLKGMHASRRASLEKLQLKQIEAMRKQFSNMEVERKGTGPTKTKQRPRALSIKSKQRVLIQAWEEIERKEEQELAHTNDEYVELRDAVNESLRKLPVSPEKKFVHSRARSSIPENQSLSSPGSGQSFLKSGRWEMGKSSGTNLEGPLTLLFTEAMIDYFRDNDDDSKPLANLLDQETATKICTQAKEILKKQPNIVRISIPDEVRMVVVGDLHGQLKDLLHILKLFGNPSAKNMYLFNGDFVDRGKKGCEIVFILCAFKILYPDYVHLNRGNHEATDINNRDGFEEECLEKYDKELYDLISSVFAVLPIMHILGDKVLVVHGGLSWDDFTLKDVEKIDRNKLFPPYDTLYEDLLWSDPGYDDETGRFDNSRGCGCVFGRDVLENFLKDENLSIMVRSHEMKENGFETHFDGKCVTVFSASDYCGDTGNKGAVLLFESNYEYKAIQFEATPSQEQRPFSVRVSKLENAVLSKIIHRISESRIALIDHFSSLEVNGAVTREQWSKGLQKVLGLKRTNFLGLADMLGLPFLGVHGEPGGPVSVHDFLSKFVPNNLHLAATASSSEGVDIAATLEKLMQIAKKHRYALKSLFRFFDDNGDKVISPEELERGLACLAKVFKVSFNEKEVKCLVKLMDKDKNGEIDYEEFLGAFTVNDKEFAGVIKKEKARHAKSWWAMRRSSM